MGNSEVKIGVEMNQPSNAAARLLGYARFKICESCARANAFKPTADAHVIDTTPLVDPLCVLLAAAITADALETKTP